MTLESASKIKMHQNLFKLTSIGMSKGSLLNEYLPISSLLLFDVAAGRSLCKFSEPPPPAGSNPQLPCAPY